LKMSLLFLFCLVLLTKLYITFGCKTDYSGFRYNNSFYILEENITRENMHQVELQEYLCMESDFCFIRNYILRVGEENSDEMWKNNNICPLELPIKILHMKIKKIAFNAGWNPQMVGITPPTILKERLQELVVGVGFNQKVTAGIWKVDQTCWTQETRTLKKCGSNFLLYEKMLTSPIAAMNLSNWILEPVTFLNGTFLTFYLHIGPQFFFQGMQNLLNHCCFKEIHIEGTKLQNVTIRNQKHLQSLYVRFTARNYIKADLQTMPQITDLSLIETTMATLPPDIKYLHNLTKLDVSNNNLTSLPSKLLTGSNLQVLNVSNNGLRTLPFNITQLTNLRVLNISRNKITSSELIYVSKLQHVEIIDLSYNSIQSIPEELSKIKNLRELNINNQELTIFSFVKSEPFVSLEVLKLAHTNYVMNNGMDVLQRVTTLKYLDILAIHDFVGAINHLGS
ncbi:hypothetical protein L9F63_002736, partial [Diploptera punctata]